MSTVVTMPPPSPTKHPGTADGTDGEDGGFDLSYVDIDDPFHDDASIASEMSTASVSSPPPSRPGRSQLQQQQQPPVHRGYVVRASLASYRPDSLGTLGSIMNNSIGTYPMEGDFEMHDGGVTESNSSRSVDHPDEPTAVLPFRSTGELHEDGHTLDLNSQAVDTHVSATTLATESSESPTNFISQATSAAPPPPPPPTSVTPSPPVALGRKQLHRIVPHSPKYRVAGTCKKNSTRGGFSSSASSSSLSRRPSLESSSWSGSSSPSSSKDASASKGSNVAKGSVAKNRKESARKSGMQPKRGPRTPSDLDVIFGRGGESNNHKGNKSYREHVVSLQVRYKTLDRIRKTECSQGVVDWVIARGGRFLKQDGKNGPWKIVPNKDARTKVSQALREDHTPSGRAAKKANRMASATSHPAAVQLAGNQKKPKAEN